MLRFTLLSALALVAACGTRSALPEGDLASGSGGAPGTSTTSSTSSTSSTFSSSSSGGSGGEAPICDVLVLSGPPITYDPSFEHASRPRLVPASEDRSRVSMVMTRQSLESPSPTPLRATNVTFAPWDAWPSGLGPDYQVLGWGADSLAVAPAWPPSKPGFALLHYVLTGAFPSDMALAASVAPETDYESFPPSVQWDGWEPAWAVALARGAKGHLAAYQFGGGPYTYLTLGLVGTGGVTVLSDAACANMPFPADVAPTQGGFLVASASGRAFGSCPDDDGIPGPPNRVQIARLDDDTASFTLATEYQDPDPISQVALAQGGQDTWVVWQNTGASAFEPPSIRAQRLTATGAPSGPIFDVTSSGATSGPFAAASLGPWLAVAWVDSIDPSTPTLRLDLFDDNGARVAGSSYNTAPFWLYEPSLSLLSSPDGRSLLLAWSDHDGGGTSAAIARVARFSCMGGL